MQKENSEWSVRMLVDFRDRIDVEHEYQRGQVWSPPQQALLIDSILRGFDIPKIYLRKLPQGSPFLFQVVDGKQRLTAIWEFFSDSFPLLAGDDFFDFGDMSGLCWSELPDSAQDALQFANISVSKIVGAEEEEIRDLFLRLQKGERLNSAEKRNAMTGPVQKFVKSELVKHPLWSFTGFSTRRYGIHELSAILLALSLKNGATSIKSADLEALYQELTFDPIGVEAKRTIALLNDLTNIASVSKGTIRTRWGLVDLALSVIQLHNENIPFTPDLVMEFFIGFEASRREVAAQLAELQTNVVRTLDESNQDLRIELPSIDTEMLTYHYRFAREGATKENVNARSSIMYSRLRDRINETINES